MKILAIVGSLRKESYNLQVATIAQDITKQKYPDIQFSFLDWSDIPLLDQDLEENPPKSVLRVREEVSETDGIWLFSPEYNHYFPGTVKNLIDWLSRPENDGRGNVLKGKPLALAGASIALSGTSHAQDHYASLFSFLQVDLMHAPRLVIPFITQQVEDGVLTLERSRQHLEDQLDAFVSFIEKKTN